MNRIQALTGLRLFAAMAIVFWHSQTGYFFEPGAFLPFYPAGAVPLFFVLSGFVLTLGRANYQGWPAFILARIARVWPAHAAAVVFLFAIFWPYSRALVGDAEGLLTLGVNLALLQAWVPDRAVYWSLNAPSWSVSCEIFFYAMFPLCVAALAPAPARRTLAGLGAALLAIAALATAWPGIDGTWLVTNPLLTLPAFLVGIAAALLHQNRPTTRARFATGSLCQLGALAAVLAANAFTIAAMPALFPPTIANGLISLAPTPVLALLLVALARHDGILSRVLALPVIVYGGEISYSIYLFHQLIIRWHSVHRESFAGIPDGLQYAAVLAATFVISAAVYHLVEQPARWLVRRTWLRQRGTAATRLTNMPQPPTGRVVP